MHAHVNFNNEYYVQSMLIYGEGGHVLLAIGKVHVQVIN